MFDLDSSEFAEEYKAMTKMCKTSRIEAFDNEDGDMQSMLYKHLIERGCRYQDEQAPTPEVLVDILMDAFNIAFARGWVARGIREGCYTNEKEQ